MNGEGRTSSPCCKWEMSQENGRLLVHMRRFRGTCENLAFAYSEAMSLEDSFWQLDCDIADAWRRLVAADNARACFAAVRSSKQGVVKRSVAPRIDEDATSDCRISEDVEEVTFKA